MDEQLPPQPVVEDKEVVTEKPKSNKFLVILLSILLLISLVITVFFAYQTQKLSNELTKLKTVDTSTPIVSNEPTIEPTTTPTNTTKPIIIPSTWKQFTAIDPEFKIKATMSMPPGFSFRFTGSEFTIQNDSDASELWDYSTSIFSGKDGLKNYYDNTSRRAWYKRKLDGEFVIPEEYQKKRGDILSISEHNIGVQSYLQILVQPLSGDQETHYLFMKNGIINIIKPASVKANSTDSQLPNYIDIIFTSLTSSTTN